MFDPTPSTRTGTELAALHTLLDEGATHAPETAHGLSNHLPMLLHALHELGAAPARQRAFAAAYATRLDTLGADQGGGGAGLSGGWREHLGERAAFTALRAAFAAALARDGLARTLGAALPVLMPGVAAGAFHGLLRTAHGLAARHHGEMASGLAYWAAAHRPLLPRGHGGPCERAAGSSLGLAAWVDAALALPTPPDNEAPSIGRRMAAWARTPGFADVATALAVDAQDPGATLAALAELAASIYATSGNFTVLHVLTSCQALRVLAPWQPDPVAALRWYAVAVAAGLRAARLTPSSLQTVRGSAPSVAWAWSDIVPAAIASDDDHVAKLVHACRALEADLGGEVFRRAATRAVAPAST